MSVWNRLMSSRWQRAGLTAGTAILLLAAVVASGLAGEITGQVGAGLNGRLGDGLRVAVMPLMGGTPASVAVQPDGSFTVPDLAGGRYVVAVTDGAGGAELPLTARAVDVPNAGIARISLGIEPAGAAAPTFNFLLYKSQFYNNKTTPESADPVTVAAGATTSGINFGLHTGGGTISGHVTADVGGAALSGLLVFAIGQNSDVVSFDRTDASGNYRITGVPADSFLVVVNTFFTAPNNDYIGEFYDNTTSFLNLKYVHVTEGADTPNINFGLALGGSISGQVTAENGGQGLGSANVTIHGAGSSLYFDTADNGGHFRVRGLPAGSYKVEARASGNFVSEFYNNKSSEGTADAVAVTSGTETANINLALGPGGTITGTVTNNVSSLPMASAYVQAMRVSDLAVGTAFTNASGVYQIQGLGSGSYKVFCSTINVWYNAKSDESEADPVSVTVGATTSNINFSGAPGQSCFLPPAAVATVTGRVTTGGSTPVADADVKLYMSLGEDRMFYSSTSTDDAGNYSLGCIPPGTYFAECVAPYTDLISRWYDNADSAGAMSLVLEPATTRANTDFNLSHGGGITGKVTPSGNANGIQYAEVLAQSTSGGPTYSTMTDLSGNYTIRESSEGGMPAGNYRVWASDHSTADLSLTPVALARFEATPVDGGVSLAWSVTDGSEAAGFLLYRATSADADPVRLTDRLLPSGSDGAFTDATVISDTRYFYTIGVLGRSGSETRLGPFEVRYGNVPVTRLLGATPNPFTGATLVRFELAAEGRAVIKVFDASGRLVRRLADGRFGAGTAAVSWDGRGDGGESAPAGVYFVALDATGQKASVKIVRTR